MKKELKFTIEPYILLNEFANFESELYQIGAFMDWEWKRIFWFLKSRHPMEKENYLRTFIWMKTNRLVAS
jgi:hypothetical protein